MFILNSTAWSRFQFRDIPCTIYGGRNGFAMGLSARASLLPMPAVTPTKISQYSFISGEGKETIVLSFQKRHSLSLNVHLQDQRSQWVLGSKQPTIHNSCLKQNGLNVMLSFTST
jgi:hypothetical protein